VPQELHVLHPDEQVGLPAEMMGKKSPVRDADVGNHGPAPLGRPMVSAPITVRFFFMAYSEMTREAKMFPWPHARYDHVHFMRWLLLADVYAERAAHAEHRIDGNFLLLLIEGDGRAAEVVDADLAARAFSASTFTSRGSKTFFPAGWRKVAGHGRTISDGPLP